MPALPRIAKTIDEKAESAPKPHAESDSKRGTIFIPPPLPIAKASLAQVREDADAVQARMRAKYGIHGKGEVRH